MSRSQQNNPWARLGMATPISRFAGLIPSAPDEPGDPQPEEFFSDDPSASDNTVTGVSSSSSPGDPSHTTGAGGTPHDTTQPSQPAQDNNVGTDAATTGSNKA